MRDECVYFSCYHIANILKCIFFYHFFHHSTGTINTSEVLVCIQLYSGHQFVIDIDQTISISYYRESWVKLHFFRSSTGEFGMIVGLFLCRLYINILFCQKTKGHVEAPGHPGNFLKILVNFPTPTSHPSTTPGNSPPVFSRILLNSPGFFRTLQVQCVPIQDNKQLRH